MFATIQLPNFELQAAFRHQPELHSRAVALLDDLEAKATILQLNEIAESTGVSRGMTASQALARCADLTIKMRNRTQESMLADLLLQCAFTLAPIVETTASGICTVQFTDTRKLNEKVRRVIDQFGAMDIRAQAGIAANADTSLLAAYAADPLLRVENLNDFLDTLPIETLIFV